MFATRNNQENVVYALQTATAAKQDGAKELAPKTPGNKALKTPFKAGRNDENAILPAAKTHGKGRPGDIFGNGKGGKAEGSAFITPAGPRARAPLGAKTTNVKTAAFRTPAAPPTSDQPSAKASSPRLRRSKIKVHDADLAKAENDSEEREIEYMPPREVPLLDYPDDVWPHDRTYPQFEGKNFSKGFWGEIEKDDGSEDAMSDLDEKLKVIEAKEQRKRQKELQHTHRKADQGKKPASTQTRNTPNTLTSKEAATALRPAVRKSSANMAASIMPKAAALKKPSTGTFGANNPRYTAAKAVSNTTVGYSKGRSLKQISRYPLSAIHEANPAGEKKHTFSSDKRNTTLDQLLQLSSLDADEIGDDDLLGSRAPVSTFGHEDDFHLEVPDV